ncbi:MAG: hypothetical protein AAF483_07315 [Planctomycetota bacterium]
MAAADEGLGEQGIVFDGSSVEISLAELLPVTKHPKPPQHYPAKLPVSAMLVDAERDAILTGGYHEILIWSLEGKLLHRIENQGQRTYALDIHPDKPLLIAASGTPGELGEVRLFDLQSRKMLAVVTKADEAIMDAQFSPDGSKLAVAMPSGATRVYAHVGAGGFRLETELLGHSSQVTALDWHVDGNRLATASRDHSAKVFNVAEGRSVATFTGHSACVNDLCFVTQNWVTSVGSDGLAVTWNSDNGRKHKDLVTGKQAMLGCEVLENKVLLVGDAVVQWMEFGNAEMKQRWPMTGRCTTCSSSKESTKTVVIGTQNGKVHILTSDGQSRFFSAAP